MRRLLPSDPLGDKLRAVRAGRLTFGELVRATAGDWQRMAQRMCRIYHAPQDIAEDLAQEMLLEAWLRLFGHGPYNKRKRIMRWDSRYGKTASQYCCYNGHVRAQQALRRVKHFQHEVQTEGDVFELLDCQYAPEPFQERTELQQLIAELAEAALEQELPDSLQRCYQALSRAGGSIDLATCLLYDDPEARITCCLGNETEAERAIIRAAKKLLS